MGFNWQDLPPAFMGTTSSFGPQPIFSTNDVSTMTFPDMNLPFGMTSDRVSSSTPADVLAAATLLQNGHTRSQHTNNDVMFGSHDLSMTMAPHLSHHTMPLTMSNNLPRSRPTIPKQEEYFGDTYYAELMFGPAAGNGRLNPKGPPKDVDIHWGSDAGFGNGQGFIAPPGQESVEAIEQKLGHVLDCIEPHDSTAASTNQNSPIAVRHAEPGRRHSDQALNGQDYAEGDDDERPRKRRKNKMKEEDDDEDEDGVAVKGPRKRRTKSIAAPSSTTTTQSPPPPKRRKSGSSSATKPIRENLTEDQKRENHIKSEQKRRTLIKEGFDDLNELVPDLRGGGHSKSVVLVMAADWLENLINGNKILKARLQELERSKVLK
jgi:Helix-loop-helix DNA-binding domain